MILLSDKIIKHGVNIQGEFVPLFINILMNLSILVDAHRLSLKFGWKELRNLVDLRYVALTMESSLWLDVKQFSDSLDMMKHVRAKLGMEMLIWLYLSSIVECNQEFFSYIHRQLDKMTVHGQGFEDPRELLVDRKMNELTCIRVYDMT